MASAALGRGALCSLRGFIRDAAVTHAEAHSVPNRPPSPFSVTIASAWRVCLVWPSAHQSTSYSLIAVARSAGSPKPSSRYSYFAPA